MTIRKVLCAIVAIALTAVSCVDKENVDPTFIADSQPGLSINGKDIFRYNPLTCQYSFNRQKAAFSIFTDSASDYITAVLSELPSEKGQKVSGELSWTTERDIKTQKISVLKVVKTAEDGTVWLWNSTEKIGLCVRIAD